MIYKPEIEESEFNARIAVEVMGWHKGYTIPIEIEPERNIDYEEWLDKDDEIIGKYYVYPQYEDTHWYPRDNINQAFKVLEKTLLDKWEWHIDFETTNGMEQALVVAWSDKLKKLKGTSFDGNFIAAEGFMERGALAHTICLVALKVVEFDKDG